MCWSLEVSIGFGCVELVCLIWMWKRNRTLADKFMWPTVASIMLVEFTEAVLWTVVEPNPSTAARALRSSCNALNQALSIGMSLNIAGQGMIFMFSCDRVSKAVDGTPASKLSPYGIPLRLSVVVFVAHIVSLLVGYINPSLRQDVGTSNYIGQETCTYAGEHGHLLWQVGVPPHFLTPSYLSVVIWLFSSVWCKPWWEIGFPSAVMAFLFAAGVVALEWSAEALSMWCWVGTFYIGYFTLSPYFLSSSWSVLDQSKAEAKANLCT